MYDMERVIGTVRKSWIVKSFVEDFDCRVLKRINGALRASLTLRLRDFVHGKKCCLFVSAEQKEESSTLHLVHNFLDGQDALERNIVDVAMFIHKSIGEKDSVSIDYKNVAGHSTSFKSARYIQYKGNIPLVITMK